MRIAVLAAALILGATPAAAATQDVAAVFGLIQVRCGICHLDRFAAAKEGVLDFTAIRREDAGDESICYSCHNGLVKDSRANLWSRFQHPAGVRPRDADFIRRSGFTLDGKGRMFCGTCHSPHIKGEGIGFFMRFSQDGGALCRRCHPTQSAGRRFGEHDMSQIKGDLPAALTAAGGAFASGQKMTCNTCHRVHSAPSLFLLRISPWGAEGLCQGCHGSNPSREKKALGLGSHPINVKKKAPVSLEWSRNNIILSPTQTVDCWSCHRAHGNPESSPLLVKDLYLGNGCARCHEEQSSLVGGRGNHPVSAMQVREEKSLEIRPSCLGCHRAHNSHTNTKVLLAYDPTTDASCTMCHKSQFEAAVNHPLRVSRSGASIAKLEAAGAWFGPKKSIMCTSCHRIHGGLKDTPSLVYENKLICVFCHQNEAALDPGSAPPGAHPIFTVLKGKLPAALASAGSKLGARGEILCLTCHRAHRAKSSHAGLVLPEKEFSCSLCHAKFQTTTGGMHAQRAYAAFSKGNAPAGAFSDPCRLCHSEHGWSRRLSEGSEDIVTEICRSCHNETGLAAAKVPGAVSHPVGVKPPSAIGLTTSLPFYLKNGRRFKKGDVSCATCHDTHSAKGTAEGKYLRLGTSGEKGLCLECHRSKNTVMGTKHDLTVMAPAEINIANVSAAAGGVCSPCHVAHGGFGRGMWARIPSGKGDFTSQMCGGCHDESQVAAAGVVGPYAHPMVPGREASTGASGASSGREVICTTCHNPHVWNAANQTDKGGPKVKGGPSDSFLREPNDENSSLCRRCHPVRAGVAGTDHDFRAWKTGDGASEIKEESRTLCGACHLVHKGQAPLGWPSKIPEKGDVTSSMCLDCHRKDGPAGGKIPGQNSHPTGISVSGVKSDRLSLFGDLGRRQSGKGALSCATCHNAHQWDPAAQSEGSGSALDGDGKTSFLRLRADGPSALCRECHTAQSPVIGSDHDLRVTAPESINLQKQLPRDSGSCGACHSVHQAQVDAFLFARTLGPGKDIRTQLCTSCHYANSLAALPPRPYAHYRREWAKEISSPRSVFAIKKSSGATDSNPVLPLFSEDGSATNRGMEACGTCHEPHRWDPTSEEPGKGIPQNGDVGNSFLRLKGQFAIKNSFCQDCHPHDVIKRFQKFHFPEEEGGIVP